MRFPVKFGKFLRLYTSFKELLPTTNFLVNKTQHAHLLLCDMLNIQNRILSCAQG